MTTYYSDPFEGDIKSEATNGQKPYTSATSDRNKDGILTIDQEHVADIMSVFRHDSNSFGWGKLINNVQNASRKTLRILADFQLVALRLAKQQVVVTWNDQSATVTSEFPATMGQINIAPENTTESDDLKTFYRRVRSNMVAKRIENSIKTYFWKNQFSNRKYLGTWVNLDDTASYDGPTILQILISNTNPSTRVGVRDLKTSIRTTKLNKLQYNVVDACDKLRQIMR